MNLSRRLSADGGHICPELYPATIAAATWLLPAYRWPALANWG